MKKLVLILNKIGPVIVKIAKFLLVFFDLYRINKKKAEEPAAAETFAQTVPEAPVRKKKKIKKIKHKGQNANSPVNPPDSVNPTPGK